MGGLAEIFTNPKKVIKNIGDNPFETIVGGALSAGLAAITGGMGVIPAAILGGVASGGGSTNALQQAPSPPKNPNEDAVVMNNPSVRPDGSFTGEDYRRRNAFTDMRNFLGGT